VVGTAAFTPVIEDIAAAAGPERILIALDSKNGKIVIKGWRESTDFTAEEVIERLEPYCAGFLCTYVDKEACCRGPISTGSGVCARLRGTRLRRRAASPQWTKFAHCRR
jgi:phosphoribosylformimino-5-aminoimidazole carboxamide ribonucleotide (ProFAR) isomerase